MENNGKTGNNNNKISMLLKEYAGIIAGIVSMGAVLIGGFIWIGSLYSISVNNQQAIAELRLDTKENQKAIQDLRLDMKSLEGKFDLQMLKIQQLIDRKEGNK